MIAFPVPVCSSLKPSYNSWIVAARGSTVHDAAYIDTPPKNNNSRHVFGGVQKSNINTFF